MVTCTAGELNAGTDQLDSSPHLTKEGSSQFLPPRDSYKREGVHDASAAFHS